MVILTGLRNIHQILWASLFKTLNAVKRHHKQSKLIPAYQNPPQYIQNRCLVDWANIGIIWTSTATKIYGLTKKLVTSAAIDILNIRHDRANQSKQQLAIITKKQDREQIFSKSQMRKRATKTEPEQIPSFSNPPQPTRNRCRKNSTWMRVIWTWTAMIK